MNAAVCDMSITPALCCNVPGARPRCALVLTIVVIIAPVFMLFAPALICFMLPAADASMKAGKWDRNAYIGTSLTGKTIAVIGFGKVWCDQ